MKTIRIRLNDQDYEMLDEVLDAMGQAKQTFYETYTKTVLRLRRIPFRQHCTIPRARLGGKFSVTPRCKNLKYTKYSRVFAP